jgi:hypothetical protein
MNTRILSRAIPALLVIALLALAAAAPVHNALGPAPPSLLPPPCSDFASAVTGDSVWVVPSGGGIEQALPPGMSVASCSLSVHPAITYNSPGNFKVREWDPTTLAPDPNAITLRRTFFDGSNLGWIGGKIPSFQLVPPVVTKSIPGVAEPPQPAVAMELTLLDFTPAARADFVRGGPAELPAAVQIHPGGARAPLPGPHPVLAHAVCSGGDDLASLRIVQAVSRTDVKPFPPPKEFIQKFRVPARVELRWIELALAEINVPYFETAGENKLGIGPSEFPQIAVYDADNLPDPVPDMPPPSVWAPFDINSLFLASGEKAWVSHLDFDHTLTLEPGHDYWIWVRKTSATTFMNRRIRGDESPLFQYSVGQYFARADSLGEWVQAADQRLCFRIVGKPVEPASPVPTSVPPPVATAFALSTSPNPAPGPVRVAWSGAVGPVQLEVLDARGRRVSASAGGAAGTWIWPGTNRDGAPVASGIYFLRARDSAGQLSSQRVMIVR